MQVKSQNCPCAVGGGDAKRHLRFLLFTWPVNIGPVTLPKPPTEFITKLELPLGPHWTRNRDLLWHTRSKQRNRDLRSNERVHIYYRVAPLVLVTFLHVHCSLARLQPSRRRKSDDEGIQGTAEKQGGKAFHFLRGFSRISSSSIKCMQVPCLADLRDGMTATIYGVVVGHKNPTKTRGTGKNATTDKRTINLDPLTLSAIL